VGEEPFAERARLAARRGPFSYESPLAAYVLYAVKCALYVLGWALFCGTSPSLGGLGSIASWWLAPLAFEKAIVWSMLYEMMGLGCGSGPLTGRYFPPLGGFLSVVKTGAQRVPTKRRDPGKTGVPWWKRRESVG
jgi:hypothetical protein